jgi:hypothetical protein
MKINKMKKWLFLVLVFVALLSCDKDNDHPDTCTDTAVVKWGRDPAADGLGWYLMDSVGGPKIYIPRNLPDYLRIDGQPVTVCLYETDEKFFCHCPQPLNKYQITFIRKK